MPKMSTIEPSKTVAKESNNSTETLVINNQKVQTNDVNTSNEPQQNNVESVSNNSSIDKTVIKKKKGALLSKIAPKLADKEKIGVDGKPIGINIPDYLFNVVCYVKYNASIRRHCSLRFLDMLIDRGDIKPGKKKYAEFKWTKIRVCCGDLIKEYTYDDDLFINSISQAIIDVANDMQRDVNKMIDVINKNISNNIKENNNK